MSANYELKIYQPNRRLSRAEAVRAVQVLVNNPCQILSFKRGYKFLKVSDGERISPDEVVEQDGTVLVSLFCQEGHREWPFAFQIFEPEIRGAQASVSIEEDVFAEDPQAAANLMLVLASSLLEAIGALFAWADHEVMLGKLEEKLSYDHLGALAWANWFNRQLAEQLGEAKLKTTPANKLASLQSGWLLTTAENPIQATSKELASQINRSWPGCQVREIAGLTNAENGSDIYGMQALVRDRKYDASVEADRKVDKTKDTSD
jgi:hypothetical protein